MVPDIAIDEWMTRSRDTLCGLDVHAVTLDGQHHTGKLRPVVRNHRACSAGAPIAKQLDPGEAKPVVNYFLEGRIGLDL